MPLLLLQRKGDIGFTTHAGEESELRAHRHDAATAGPTQRKVATIDLNMALLQSFEACHQISQCLAESGFRRHDGGDAPGGHVQAVTVQQSAIGCRATEVTQNQMVRRYHAAAIIR